MDRPGPSAPPFDEDEPDTDEVEGFEEEDEDEAPTSTVRPAGPPVAGEVTWPGWAWLPPVQVGVVGAVVGGQRLLGDGVSLLLPLLALFGVTGAALWVGGQRGGLSPHALPIFKRLGVMSGLTHWAAAAAAYAGAFFLAPEQFDFGPGTLIWAAPAVGLVVGVVAFGITMMAADTVRTVLNLPR